MLVPHLICPASAMTCCRPMSQESILDAVIANVNLQLCWFLSDRYKYRFAVCYGTVVLSVCNVGVLWPNSWTDQNATWYGGRPWPTQHCVRWGPSSPHGKGHSSSPLPHFLARVYCGRRIDYLSNCCALIMVALCNRAFLPCDFYLLLSFFSFLA